MSADGLPTPRRYIAHMSVALGILMSASGGAAVNVALPTFQHELGVSTHAAIWIANAYNLVLFATLMPMVSLAEIVGYRRMYLGGIALFTLGALASSLTQSYELLIAARIVQALGGAAALGLNAAMMRFISPKAQVGRAIGVNTSIAAISSMSGPLLAGVILAFADWPWLFAVNVPLGIVALLIGWRTLPETPRAQRVFDGPSAVLNVVSFGFLILAMNAIGDGTPPWALAAEFALGAAALAILVRRQISAPAPFLAFDLFRRPVFALSIAGAALTFIAQALAWTGLPFHLQYDHGFSAGTAGALVAAWPLALTFVSPFAGRLAERVPPGWLGALGLCIIAAGLVLLATLPADPSVADVFWRMALCGVGFGLFQGPNTVSIITSAPEQRSAAANGLLVATRLGGQTIGASLLALYLSPVFNATTTHAFLTGAVLAVLAAVVSASRVQRARRG